MAIDIQAAGHHGTSSAAYCYGQHCTAPSASPTWLHIFNRHKGQEVVTNRSISLLRYQSLAPSPDSETAHSVVPAGGDYYYPAVDTHLAGTSLGRRSDHSQHPIVVSPTPPRTNPTIMAPPSRLLGDKAHAGGRQPVLRYSPGLICKSVPHPHSRAPDHYRTLRKRPGSLKSPVCG